MPKKVNNMGLSLVLRTDRIGSDLDPIRIRSDSDGSDWSAIRIGSDRIESVSVSDPIQSGSIRISGSTDYPTIRLSDYPIIRLSDYPIIRLSDYPTQPANRP